MSAVRDRTPCGNCGYAHTADTAVAPPCYPPTPRCETRRKQRMSCRLPGPGPGGTRTGGSTDLAQFVRRGGFDPDEEDHELGPLMLHSRSIRRGRRRCAGRAGPTAPGSPAAAPWKFHAAAAAPTPASPWIHSGARAARRTARADYRARSMHSGRACPHPRPLRRLRRQPHQSRPTNPERTSSTCRPLPRTDHHSPRSTRRSANRWHSFRSSRIRPIRRLTS